MSREDLKPVPVVFPKISYDPAARGLVIDGPQGQQVLLDVGPRPQGFIELTSPLFGDVGRDPDFVAAREMDFVIQSAITARMDLEEATARVSGIRAIMKKDGYYVISVSEDPAAPVTSRMIKEACARGGFAQVLEQPITFELIPGEKHPGLIIVTQAA